MNFSDKLIELRKEKGWSQEELGNRLDVSRQTISKWELGQTTPEMNKLIELSKLFKVSIDEILDNQEYSSKQEVIYVNMRYQYEYKSERTLFGLPLVHINIGRGFRKAKGVIAIGNIAYGILSLGFVSLGIVSLGFLSLALLSFGLLTIGGVSFGAISIGLFAIGGIAIGYLSIGGLSIGVYAIGGCSLASNIALGGYASGKIAIGDNVHGTYEFLTSSYNNYFEISNKESLSSTILELFPNIPKFIYNLFMMLLK